MKNTISLFILLLVLGTGWHLYTTPLEALHPMLAKYKPMVMNFGPGNKQSEIAAQELQANDQSSSQKFSVNIQSLPAGAEIFIDNVSQNKFTPAILYLDAGKTYDLILKKEGLTERQLHLH